MKKYIKMLPVILYPYMYVIFLIGLFLTSKISEDIAEKGIDNLNVIALIYNVYCFVIVIINAVCMVKGSMTTTEVARMNLIIKCVQIPAYITHFILGLVGFFLGIWGIGLLLWAIFIDVATICFTGINSIGCSIRMYKDKVFSRCKSIFMGIGCFLFCIDIAIAIIYYIKAISVERHWVKNNKKLSI